MIEGAVDVGGAGEDGVGEGLMEGFQLLIVILAPNRPRIDLLPRLVILFNEIVGERLAELFSLRLSTRDIARKLPLMLARSFSISQPLHVQLQG